MPWVHRCGPVMSAVVRVKNVPMSFPPAWRFIESRYRFDKSFRPRASPSIRTKDPCRRHLSGAPAQACTCREVSTTAANAPATPSQVAGTDGRGECRLPKRGRQIRGVSEIKQCEGWRAGRKDGTPRRSRAPRRRAQARGAGPSRTAGCPKGEVAAIKSIHWDSAIQKSRRHFGLVNPGRRIQSAR